MMKSQQYNKDEIYPEDFTDEDKLNFDIYLQQALQLFPQYTTEQWLVKDAIRAYIRREKGQGIEVSQEEVEELKKKYNENKYIYYTEDTDTNEVL